MQAAVLGGPAEPFHLREVDLEAPHAGEALVRIAASGLCGYRAGDTAGALAGDDASAAGPAQVGEPVLIVTGLNARYGSQATLFDIDLQVGRNECVALVGESGSGKTTLARCVAGLHRDYTGDVALGSVVLPPSARGRSAEARRQIQYVFQNP